MGMISYSVDSGCSFSQQQASSAAPDVGYKALQNSRRAKGDAVLYKGKKAQILTCSDS